MRLLIPIALVGALGSAAAAYALRPSDTPASVLGSQLVNGNNGNGNGNADEAAKSFLVAGDVEGLAPGVTRPLLVQLSNPNNTAISVEKLSVTVGNSSTGCAGTNVRVGAFGAPVLLPARGSAQISLPVTMLGTAPAACQGATFPLTYGGSAVKA
jgi:hypothetical protein